jgi:putative CocE/NonD family hydrolase
VADQTPLEIEIELDLGATMRDGTVLRADAYRPTRGGPWPVLLARTPYGKQDATVLARLDPFGAARRGYLVILQDCRGRFRSDGHWTPLADESTDGYDTIGWAAKLPGADGRVGMYGPSYLGHTQWAAIEALPAALCVAVPGFTWSDPTDGLIARGGAYELGLVTHWTLTLGVNVLERRYANSPGELRRRLAALNTALDGLATGTYWELPADQAPTLRRLGLRTPTAGHPRDATAGVPTLAVAGWFDALLQGSIDNHLRARAGGAPAALIVGPWSHGNHTSRIGETEFGAVADAASVDDGGSLLTRELDWVGRYLKPERAAAASQPPVLVFVMGTNQWRRFHAWPPESVEVPWYLNAGRRLSLDPPESDSPPDAFRHDPADPVPTCGGALLMAPEFPPGPYDQRRVEERDDVLIYTSAPLREPLEVIGRITVHLVADSTAPSTDWVARLCDVDTNGVSRNITDGILRTQRTQRTQQPGTHTGHRRPASAHVVDLWSTAHVFLPGHRIRLQIASSCFPRWDRNLGYPDATARGGADVVAQQPLTIAYQSVYHDTARPSRIILPVVLTDPESRLDGGQSGGSRRSNLGNSRGKPAP